MDKKKDRQLPEEIKSELLKLMEKEIESITITNNGKPCTFYELKGKVLDIGKRYKQQMLEKIAELEAEEYGKKKHVHIARGD